MAKISQLNQSKINKFLKTGIEAHQAEFLDKAKLIYKEVLNSQPYNFVALHLLGVLEGQRKNYSEAVRLLSMAIKINPNDVSTYFNLGKAYQELNNLEPAIVNFRKAIDLDPNDPEIYNNLGNVLVANHQLDFAIYNFDKAIALNPNFSEAYNNSAVAFKELKKFDKAMERLNQAITLKLDYAEAYNNKGIIFKEKMLFDLAIECFNKAITLKPDYAEAYNNIGRLLMILRRFSAGLMHIDKAIAINENYPDAYLTRGMLLTSLKDYPQALHAFEKALELNPKLNYLLGLLIGIKQQMCDWSNYEEFLVKIYKDIKNNYPASLPFGILSISELPEINLSVAKSNKNENYPVSHKPYLAPTLGHNKKNRIRIGYYSPDFKEHPVAYLISGVFNSYDKNQFEVIGFSLDINNNSLIYQHFENTIDQMIDISKMSDAQVVDLSRVMQIDIAIDLTGDTLDSRFNIFVNRVAPIQIGYLGFLGTMGHECLDYLIADTTIIPMKYQQFYTEKILYLPSYHVNDPENLKSSRVLTRQELGLPEKGFIFCCFNNNYKITPDVFSSWMNILKAVKNSILWIYAENHWVKANLTMEAQKRNIATNRIFFSEKVSRADYLARYQVADLFLDTAPYNAGTTASDALYQGLPVLTRIGKTFSGRMAASILMTMELPELITQNYQEYESLAIMLATNPDRLAQVREKISLNRSKSILYKPDVFTRNLERAFQFLLAKYSEGLEQGL
jgi:protein O-GlcNAc transferase